MKTNTGFSSERLPSVARRAKEGGSVLIVAMLFSAIIAISLTSFMKLAINAGKLADRSFYLNGAQNLSDIGMEQVLWSLNNTNWTSASGFTLWSGHALNYQGTFPSTTPYQFSQGVTGTVKVWVDASTSTPHAVSKATINLPDGTSITKFSESYMRQRSFFTNGMVAKDTITFVGNSSVDSWNSDPDNNSATAAIAFSTAVDNDGGRVASASVQVASLSVGNADVYGYASVGGTAAADLSVGSTGRVGPYGTANGVIDPTRVTYDFTTSFPDVSAPVPSGTSYTIAAVTATTTFPRGGDVAAADGKYYYSVPSMTLSGSDTVSITAGTTVVLMFTNTTGDTIRTTGNAEIDIPATSNLNIYTAGDIAIGGNGLLNGATSTPAQPKNVSIYGTRSANTAAGSSMQSFDISGNGFLSAIVYAPNSAVKVNGNGDTYGAIIGNTVRMNGNGAFHYDESLANLNTSSLWGLTKWRELTTSTDRATYTTQLNF